MRFQNILVQATPQTDPDPAMRMAGWLAQQDGASITVFDVAPDLSWPAQYLAGGWEQTIETISGSKQKLLKEAAESFQADGILAKHVLADGRLSAAIVKQVLDGQHDLVIKVAERSANRSGFLGSTDFRLLRQCPCPLLILKHDEEVGFQHVTLALDVMDDHPLQQQLDQKVVDAAATFCNAEVSLVYALPKIEESIWVTHADQDLITENQLDDWEAELSATAEQKLAALQQRLGVDGSQCHLLRGPPAEAIPEFVNTHGIDLLVMGTIARSGLEGLLMGNTADRVLEQVDCSILALKPDNFVSPLHSAYSSVNT